MKVEQVAKLSPEERFLYWIQERHSVYLKKEAGESKPWTNDEILRSYFFTNPYRENDKVTKWFRERIREPLRDSKKVALATVIFRWFNYIPTGEIILGWLTNWDKEKVQNRLGEIRDSGGQVFTGAFMINSPGGEPKLEAICRRIDNVWQDKKRLISGLEKATTLEESHKLLTKYDGLGGFMAYEVVTDLRHTYLLENATDIMTWANPGPGCVRGLYRVAAEPIKTKGNASSPPLPKDYLERMQKLLELANTRLADLPKFEMREIEHSLCEYDKYERMRLGDGRAKRKYQGV